MKTCNSASSTRLWKRALRVSMTRVRRIGSARLRTSTTQMPAITRKTARIPIIHFQRPERRRGNGITIAVFPGSIGRVDSGLAIDSGLHQGNTAAAIGYFRQKGAGGSITHGVPLQQSITAKHYSKASQ